MSTTKSNVKNQTDVSNELDIMTMAELKERYGFCQVNPWFAYNENGYPFITFIDENNKAENIYVSRSEAERNPELYEQPEDGSNKEFDIEFLMGFNVVKSIRESDGQELLKLTRGSGNRMSF